MLNPHPGTVVDDKIVEKNDEKHFDFYMISNRNPVTATAKPVNYSIVINTLNL